MANARRARKRNALREAIFELFSAVGVLLGVYTALPMIGVERAAPAVCRRSTTEAIGDCVGQSFAQAYTPVLVHIATFAVAGALLGAVVALTLVRARD